LAVFYLLLANPIVQSDIVAKGADMEKSMDFKSFVWITFCSLGSSFLLSFGSMFIIANLSNGTAESMAYLSGILGGIVGLVLGAMFGWKTKD
jgi:hypothetical protein